MDVQNYFLHAPDDQELLTIRHIPGNDNGSSNFTKNVTAAVFNHHIPHYARHDEYVKVQE